MALRVVGFFGYGPLSAGARRNLVAAVESLREAGVAVEYSEVTVPALDVEEFEPFALVDGVEVYVPSTPVEGEKLAEYIVAAGSVALGAALPLPPVAMA